MLTREVEEFKGKLSTLTSILADLAALKMEVAALGDKVAAFPDHRDDIARLHRDIKGLLANLGVSESLRHSACRVYNIQIIPKC